MINDKRNCNLCNQNNYVSIIYGKYVACDVCIRKLISDFMENSVKVEGVKRNDMDKFL